MKFNENNQLMLIIIILFSIGAHNAQFTLQLDDIFENSLILSTANSFLEETDNLLDDIGYSFGRRAARRFGGKPRFKNEYSRFSQQYIKK